jgi:hypothetical protein
MFYLHKVNYTFFSTFPRCLIRASSNEQNSFYAEFWRSFYVEFLRSFYVEFWRSWCDVSFLIWEKTRPFCKISLKAILAVSMFHVYLCYETKQHTSGCGGSVG